MKKILLFLTAILLAVALTFIIATPVMTPSLLVGTVAVAGLTIAAFVVIGKKEPRLHLARGPAILMAGIVVISFAIADVLPKFTIMILAIAGLIFIAVVLAWRWRPVHAPISTSSTLLGSA